MKPGQQPDAPFKAGDIVRRVTTLIGAGENDIHKHAGYSFHVAGMMYVNNVWYAWELKRPHFAHNCNSLTAAFFNVSNHHDHN